MTEIQLAKAVTTRVPSTVYPTGDLTTDAEHTLYVGDGATAGGNPVGAAAFAPITHAATHGAGEDDEVTPSSIGAVQVGELVQRVTSEAELAAGLAGASAGQTILVQAALSGAGIVIPAGVRLLAADGASWRATSGTYAVTMSAGSRLEGLAVTCDGASRGIGWGAVAGAVAERVTVAACPSEAFRCEASIRPRIIHCSSTGASIGLLLNSGTEDAWVEGGVHTDCTSNLHYVGGIYIPSATRSRLIGVAVTGATTHGVYIDSSAVDTVLDGVRAAGCGTIGGANDRRGISINAAQGVRLQNVFADANQECGIFVNATATDCVFLNVTARGNNTGLRPGGHGLEMHGTGQVIGGLFSGQLGAADSSGGGIYTGSDGLAIIGATASGNWGHGIRLYNANMIRVVSNLALNNSQASAAEGGDHNGIDVNSSSSNSNIVITGNCCTDTQETKTQQYGIGGVGTSSGFVVYGNDCLGNATGEYGGTFTSQPLVVAGGLAFGKLTSGAPGPTHSSGAGAPGIAGAVGDMWWRTDAGAGTLLYRCTVAGAAGAATWAAVL